MKADRSTGRQQRLMQLALLAELQGKLARAEKLARALRLDPPTVRSRWADGRAWH